MIPVFKDACADVFSIKVDVGLWHQFFSPSTNHQQKQNKKISPIELDQVEKVVGIRSRPMTSPIFKDF